MRDFETMNPAAVSVHLLLTACITLFCLEPVLLGISFFFAVLYFIVRNGRKHVSFHAFAIGIPLLFAVLNPLWNQHGTTVLFLINDRAYTLEALCYGAVTGLRLAAVLYWFRNFSDLMTSEKLFYLFRFLSPKLALIFTMAVRNITLFRTQLRQIHRSQRAMGLYRGGHLIDDIRGGLREFSILLTWALENGIITASSMAARGYGSGKRTSCTFYRWHRGDILLLLTSILLAACVLYLVSQGYLSQQYYPNIAAPKHGLYYIFTICTYTLLASLPCIYTGKETLSWHCLQSEI